MGDMLSSKEGHSLFPPMPGLLCVNPNFLKQSFAPVIQLTNFKILNKSLTIKEARGKNGRFPGKSISEIENISLNYTDFIFSFEFAVLDFNASKKNSILIG